MKQKHFYHHLVTIESIHIALTELDLENDEREELLVYAESTLHHSVLDALLTKLPPDGKKTFLANIHKNDHDAIWRHLKEEIRDVEEIIKTVAKEVETALHEDIKEAKTKK